MKAVRTGGEKAYTNAKIVTKYPTEVTGLSNCKATSFKTPTIINSLQPRTKAIETRIIALTLKLLFNIAYFSSLMFKIKVKQKNLSSLK